MLIRALTGIVLGMAASGFSCGILSQGRLLAAGDPKTERPAPAASTQPGAKPASESPAVSLSRGGPLRTGSISASHLPEHPAVLWSVSTEGDPGTPILADGVIYVGDRKETLYAIKLADGSVLWRTRGLGLVYFAPAKRGETIYVSSSNGLTALSQSDGKVFWNRKLQGDPTESSPLVVKDRIIVADTSGTMYAFSLDGAMIWEHDMIDDERARLRRTAEARIMLERGGPSPHAARARTAASDGTTIFQPIFDESRRLLAVDLAAGKRRWSLRAKGMIYGEPAVTDDRVFFGTQDGDSFDCVDKRRKTVVWTFPVRSRVEAGPAVRDGSVFFGSCDGRFYRVNAETGKAVWSYQTPRSPGVNTAIYSAPVCTDNAVYFGSFDGHLYCLKIGNGELKWRFQPVKGSEITASPETDGRRIVLAIRRNSAKQGQDAIVAIGEDQSKDEGIGKQGRRPLDTKR